MSWDLNNIIYNDPLQGLKKAVQGCDNAPFLCLLRCMHKGWQLHNPVQGQSLSQTLL